MMARLIPALLLASALALSNAATITGLVIGVADGDTVTVLDASKAQHKIPVIGDRRTGKETSLWRSIKAKPERFGV